MGPWDGCWVGTGIAPLPPTPVRTTPGTPSPYPAGPDVDARVYSGAKYGRGLKSVAQLTLSTQISGFPGITEVYNL